MYVALQDNLQPAHQELLQEQTCCAAGQLA
jgi:hypothetical protein